MKTLVLALVAAGSLAAPALAQSAGDMTLGFGVGYVNPKSDNGTVAGGATVIGDNTCRPRFRSTITSPPAGRSSPSSASV